MSSDADRNRYTAKHAQGMDLNKIIVEAIEKKAQDKEINCADATAIAASINVDTIEVGATLDLLGVRIRRCRLGLFGYEGKRPIVGPAQSISADLERAIRENLKANSLSCIAAWNIAARADIPMTDVTSACEALNIKIKPCQLGAF